MRLKPLIALAMLVVGGVLIGVAFADPQSTGSRGNVREGGTFRIAYLPFLFAGIDPAVALDEGLVDTTCGKLVNYPDKRPPAGLRVAPELAGMPKISRDGKTYTFTIRRGLRMSDGSRVTALNFAQAFRRALAPSMDSGGRFYLEDVVGAAEVQEGALPKGIVARGNRLTIKLTRPVGDFTARMTLTAFCAVPPNLPIDPEGARAPVHSAGPYYTAEYVPGRRLVLKENRFYKGPRPHHVDKFVVDFNVSSSQEVIDRVKAGRADWGSEDEAGTFPDKSVVRLKRQFHVGSGLGLFGFWLNSSRGIFKGNASLRRAVNFALDRRALVDVWGGSLAARPVDQYLPPGIPGFKDARIYPLNGPDFRTARSLARGHLRSRKAILYIRDLPVFVKLAQIVRRNLGKIGLDVEIQPWPRGDYYTHLYANDPPEPWDIGQYGWIQDYVDPFTYLNGLFVSDAAGNPHAFRSKKYDRLLTRASRLAGTTRYRTYGELDVRLAREEAPMMAAFYGNVGNFVSKRVDPRCVIAKPYLDLAAVCLK